MNSSANKSTDLTPETLFHSIRSYIGSHPWADHLHVLAATRSTNDDALAHPDAPHGSTFIAIEQLAGRGRLGRTWFSRPGDSLCLSTLLHHHSPALTLSAGLAAWRTLTSLTGLTLAIKWPNDILAEGAKLCGILTESAVQGSVQRTVVGFGINLNQSANDFPPELRAAATSLFLLTGRTWNLAECAARLLHDFYAVLEMSPAAMLQEWKSHSAGLGQHIHLHTPDGELSGILLDIEPDGALLLQPSGSTQPRRLVSAEIIR